MASPLPPSVVPATLFSTLPLMILSTLPSAFPLAISPPLPSALGKEVNEQSKPEHFTSQGPRGLSPDIETESEAGDLSEIMAPRSSQRNSGKSASSHRREADLSAVLSTPQKDELMLLVASITGAMQEHVCKVFDQQDPSLGCSLVSAFLISEPKKPVLTDTSGNIATRPSPEQVTKPLNSGGVQGELRKEALAAFQRWQIAITKRMSEIAVSADLPVQASQSQTKPTAGRHSGRTPGRGLGRSGRVGGGSREIQSGIKLFSHFHRVVSFLKEKCANAWM